MATTKVGKIDDWWNEESGTVKPQSTETNTSKDETANTKNDTTSFKDWWKELSLEKGVILKLVMAHFKKEKNNKKDDHEENEKKAKQERNKSKSENQLRIGKGENKRIIKYSGTSWNDLITKDPAMDDDNAEEDNEEDDVEMVDKKTNTTQKEEKAEGMNKEKEDQNPIMANEQMNDLGWKEANKNVNFMKNQLIKALLGETILRSEDDLLLFSETTDKKETHKPLKNSKGPSTLNKTRL
ncbi:hypothetical protein RFI_02840 [Reticulomyxa filosa]|uniref:Uncharacterized protein n=1 Tax=Reticulomyxa filosa TaxID=46433 RepID=X6P6T3_RETFI|nr:hypothetical protein RFI_02840 [Reticulomyxa filosa]|eukprot:ETO34255.1 hypothetical protein RFI_02840 [Reticulomyxa filosa]